MFVVTVIWPTPAEWGGAVAVICPELFTVKLLAGVPPNDTPLVPPKLLPRMVTVVPPALVPVPWLIHVTAGAGAVRSTYVK